MHQLVLEQRRAGGKCSSAPSATGKGALTSVLSLMLAKKRRDLGNVAAARGLTSVHKIVRCVPCSPVKTGAGGSIQTPP